MHIALVERVVERCMDRSSPNYQEITKLSTKTLTIYDSNFIPRKGDVICIDGEHGYDVVEVIYNIGVLPIEGEEISDVVIEVVPHIEKHTYSTGNYSYVEDWPLITNLDSDLLDYLEAIED